MGDSGEQKIVLHIITGLNDGGAEAILTSLCLYSKQVQYVVVSLMGAGKYGPLLTESGVKVHCLGMNPGKPSLLRFYRLIRLIKLEQPDVVQTWMYHADFLGGIAARLAGVQRVFWGVHHANLAKNKNKKSTIIIAHLCALFSKWVPEKIICCSKRALKTHAKFGYKASKLVVISNGFDLSFFKPNAASGAEIRNELGLVAGEFILGMVGRFDPLKDHSNLLRALSLVAEKRINFRCLLVGKGLLPDNVALTTQISELGLQNKVLLIGQRTDIPAVMNALDMHVLSSCSESFANVIAEAMACAVPCVSTDVGAALDMIGDESACCPAGDSKALAGLIINMAHEWQEKPSAWQMRKNASAQRIIDRYSIDGMVAAYESYWFYDQRDLG